MSNYIEPAKSDPEVKPRVLVIYTGGTIGMMLDKDKGWVPAPNALGRYIFCCPTLHDKDYAVAEWGKKAKDYGSGTPFVLPPHQGMPRIMYDLKEYPELLDSSNMTCKEWIKIAKDIEDSYDLYDGFVILHGTDTMAYTASALSFMLQHLKKSVVVTGAQLSIYEPRSDAKNNFLESLIMAGNFVIPEVTICFGRKLFRGNRSTKMDSDGFDAFDTPNYPLLASLGVKIQRHDENIFWPTGMEKLQVHTVLNENVAILHFYPGIKEEMVRATLQPPLEGLVLLTYGSGNVPSNRQELLDEIKIAIDRGVLVINCTQCSRGTVSDIYETGKALSSIGVIAGEDMTPEAASTKLSYVLGRDDWSLEKKKEMMLENLRGELTPSDSSLFLASSTRMTIWKALMNPTTLNNVVLPAMISHSVSFSDIRRIEELINHGGDISAASREGRTALHIAASEGNNSMVKYLLDKGVKVDAIDSHNQTPLSEAVRFNKHEIIKLLYSKGATLNTEDKRLGEKLCRAAAQNDVRKLQSLKLAGVNLRQADASGRTALHMAALNGHHDCTKFLIDEGCPKDQMDNLGLTPKDYAQRSNSATISLF
ncbi:L-asparaginase 1-like [Ischnura elegans]|uniref:L-asparaginase 1-like n=1 Tax=Ischnura elegans TaxID=197161 RepID=UPI001ED89810|nr:L-asparaginase 1-like [Ischnura elegans]